MSHLFPPHANVNIMGDQSILFELNLMHDLNVEIFNENLIFNFLRRERSVCFRRIEICRNSHRIVSLYYPRESRSL